MGKTRKSTSLSSKVKAEKQNESDKVLTKNPKASAKHDPSPESAEEIEEENENKEEEEGEEEESSSDEDVEMEDQADTPTSKPEPSKQTGKVPTAKKEAYPEGLNRKARRRLQLIERQKVVIRKRLGIPEDSTEPNEKFDKELEAWTTNYDALETAAVNRRSLKARIREAKKLSGEEKEAALEAIVEEKRTLAKLTAGIKKKEKKKREKKPAKEVPVEKKGNKSKPEENPKAEEQPKANHKSKSTEKTKTENKPKVEGKKVKGEKVKAEEKLKASKPNKKKGKKAAE